MKTRAPAYIRKRLQDALSSARLERAGFGMPSDTVSVNGGEPQPLDAFVKEQMRLYLGSWVVRPIQVVADWADGR